MLDAKIASLKRSGKENTVHKPCIEEEDMHKLKTTSVFNLTNPLSLLINVWFHVVLFFCRRGREGQRSLTTTSFKFETDAAGRKFITIVEVNLNNSFKCITCSVVSCPVSRTVRY